MPKVIEKKKPEEPKAKPKVTPTSSTYLILEKGKLVRVTRPW